MSTEQQPIPEEFLKAVIEETRETTPSFFFNEISAKNAAIAAYRHLSSQQKQMPADGSETNDEKTYRKLSEWYLKQLYECEEQLRAASSQAIVGEQLKKAMVSAIWMAIEHFQEAAKEDMSPLSYNEVESELYDVLQKIYPRQEYGDIVEFPKPSALDTRPIVDKEVPEEIKEWIKSQCAEDVPEVFRVSKARHAFEQGHEKGCISTYHKMQEIVAMHMEVIAAAVSTTDALRAEITDKNKQITGMRKDAEGMCAEIKAQEIRISTDGEQIAALLSALKERGEMYLTVEKELLAARDRLKRIAVARSAFESTGIARTHLAEYPSST